MGYYIQTSRNKGKAAAIVELHAARFISKKEAENYIDDPSKAVIIVVDNGPFEAAGFDYDRREWQAFTSPADDSPKQYLVMDRKKGERIDELSQLIGKDVFSVSLQSEEEFEPDIKALIVLNRYEIDVLFISVAALQQRVARHKDAHASFSRTLFLLAFSRQKDQKAAAYEIEFHPNDITCMIVSIDIALKKLDEIDGLLPYEREKIVEQIKSIGLGDFEEQDLNRAQSVKNQLYSARTKICRAARGQMGAELAAKLIGEEN